MMLGNVFLKSLRDQRWSLAWWGVGVSLLAAFLVAMFPSIKGIEGFDEVVEAYPKELMAFFGA
ncbi:MAG: ABC transporter permease, partial [SAR202 cluster bacterium]|nr:ABC transporter permease [SAR202 cluster bacterium]